MQTTTKAPLVLCPSCLRTAGMAVDICRDVPYRLEVVLECGVCQERWTQPFAWMGDDETQAGHGIFREEVLFHDLAKLPTQEPFPFFWEACRKVRAWLNDPVQA